MWILTAAARKAREDGVGALVRFACSRVRYEIWLARVKRGRPVPFHGIQLKLDAPITAWARSAIYSGSYEAEEIRLIREHLPRDQPVIELGGGIGATSTLMQAHLDPRETQVTVEAIPELVDVIGQQQSVNDQSYAVEHAAYAPASKTVEFFVDHDHYTISSRDSGSGAPITVPATSLEDLCSKYSLDSFSVVSDIEGAEEEMIRSESELLERNCECMIIEVHPESCDVGAIEEVLRSSNFECVAVQNGVYVYK